IKNDNLPRGVRKVETELTSSDLNLLKLTIPSYDKQSLLNSLRDSVSLYRHLRIELFGNNVQLHEKTEKKVMNYFEEIENTKD
ncbi:MAG: nucleotidyltransferase domain-containing protein, partial [Bacteroidia bacterium]